MRRTLDRGFVPARTLALALVLAAAAPVAGAGTDFKAEVGIEGRAFFSDPADARQADGDVSLRLQPEFYADWNDRDTSVTFTPFGRLDSADDERTHWDVRELYLRHRRGDVEGRIGVRRVFWGATESVHLVDVINQTDGVENPDGEDKLGQPMVNLAWTRSGHTVDLFLLPYFRERTFPGIEGRLRPTSLPPPFDGFPVYVTNDRAVYESGDEEQHLDAALRYAFAGDGLDVGLSHFSGTARAPRFRAADAVLTADGIELVPYYELIERSGVDATLVAGGWLLKFEAIHQTGGSDKHSAAAGGFEYTLNGVFESAWDVGLLAEYLWDERGDAVTPANNDIFVGTRIVANDVAGSELLAGAVVDADTRAAFANLEASRRLGGGFKLTVEARLFERAPPADPAYQFRRDDYVSVDLTWFY